MSDLGLVLPIGLVLLVAFFFLRRIDDSPATAHWAKAWIALYAAGVLSSANLSAHWPADLAPIPLQLFAAYLLAGALAISGRSVPQWIVPFAAVLGCLGSLQMALGDGSGGHLFTLVALPPFALGAAWVLWRPGEVRHWRTPEGWLAPLVSALAIMTLVDPLVRHLEAPTLPLYVGWIGAALALGVVQLMGVEDRVRSRQDDLLRAMKEQTDLLRDEQSRLHSLIDASPAGILLVDGAGVIRATNPVLLRHLGEDPVRSWVGLHLHELEVACAPRIAPDSRAALNESLRKIDLGAVERVEDLDIHFVDPADRVLRMYSAPVHSDSNGLHGQLWLSLDVTMERKLGQQLHEVRRMETLGTLAGGVAHDFNNHLTPVLGNAWLLRQSLDEDDPLQAVARDIEEAAQHCAGMTRDLLTMARRAPAQPRALDTRDALEKAVAHFGRRLAARERVSLEILSDVPPLLADPDQLARVLDSVLGNALDAIEGRGDIHVRAWAESRSGPELGWVSIEVRDDGTGMDEQTRGHIFEPFFTTKDVGAGSGLGLAIAYGIIEAHGGQIDVASKPDAGTAVCIRWPAAQAQVDDTPKSRGDTSKTRVTPAPLALHAPQRSAGGKLGR